MKRNRQKIWVLAMGLLILLGGCGSENGSTGPSNHAPTLNAQPDTTVAVGDTLHLWALADDPDGDVLTLHAVVIGTLSDFKLRGLPDFDFDPTDGHFEFRPKTIDRPDRVFRFEVDDGRGGCDSTTFTVGVN
jgi:hypothetical protein